jgi:diguanylate cyclase (GGDEF)-like protein
MIPVNILIFNKNYEESEFFHVLCQRYGSVLTSSTLEKTSALARSTNLQVVVVDAELASYSSLKGLFRDSTSIIITGRDESRLKEVIKEWPSTRYADYQLISLQEQDNSRFYRALKFAIEHSQLRTEVENLKHSLELNDLKLKEVYSEIKEIKNFISESILKELEKRISIETKYIRFKSEKQKIEKILRNLYTANDVSNLLDIVYDIKEIVQAQGISLYIIDENESLGKYLKPLVWDDAFLSPSDFSKYIALIDSQDFAASAAHYGQEINISELSFDSRMSKRYIEQLKTPLKSILVVPIMHDKDIIGVIEVYNKIVKGGIKKEGFTREDQQILRELSTHISLAMTKLNLIQYDALTGLLRPDPFFEKVIQKIESQTKRRQEEGLFAMAMGDVDWFKNYNDRNGHEAGNKLLRELAQELKQSIREDDLICRYGGEEFLFFLTGVNNIDEALLLTERIRKNVEEHYFEFEESQPRNNLTMSFGVTIFPKDKAGFHPTLTKNDLKLIANEANNAMAEAKGKKISAFNLGEKPGGIPTKNRVCAYSRERAGDESRTDMIKSLKEIFFKEKRKFERFYAATPLVYKENDTHKVTKTINLSIGGTKIKSDAPLTPGRTIDLFIIVGNKASHLKGEVVWSEKAGGDAYYTGLKFRDLDFANRKILEDYFSSLIKKRNVPS